MSLLIQSLVEEPPSLDCRPGTTRGILGVYVVVSVRVRIRRCVRRGIVKVDVGSGVVA
jgi:hypothetical protein